MNIDTTKTLAQTGLVEIPVVDKKDNRSKLDDYLSVFFKLRFVWSDKGIVVNLHNAAKAQQAMVDAHDFITERAKA